ncbi:glycosyltransferase family 2 protein [Candidatus Margulisiibacteriota bacterium]
MISVIIGTYNQKDTLKIVLESLLAQSLSPQEYEIIVVDSSSTDGTEEIVKGLKVRYLRVPNQGKAAARNQGVKAAQGDIILFTDADMIAQPRLLEEHLATHKKHSDVSVEGLTLNLKEKISPYNLSPDHPTCHPYIKGRIKPFKKLKWSYFLSGNLSLRKKDFVKAGGFDEKFSGYGWEDVELGYRLHKIKVPLIYNPQAINYHYHFVTPTNVKERKYNMGQSAAYFYKKHPNFTIKMFLGLNPLAMGIFKLLKKSPALLDQIKNQYLLEEYYYRLGLTEELAKS